MLEKFHAFSEANNLFEDSNKILLAISGGIDSMVMLDLFVKSEINFGVAHCNFGLRANESIDDEKFIKSYCTRKKIPFFSKMFDTEKYALEKKISIQIAARELRYDWFEILCKKNNYNLIATAHHFDDSVETFFINLSRGTGLKGLTGISVKNKNVIRPLLFATKNEIIDYQKKFNIEYRCDSSNNSLKYKRNIIRHQLIPIFEKINPGFSKVMRKNLIHFSELNSILNDEIAKKTKSVIRSEGKIYKINIPELKKLEPIHTYLYELISKFNFSSSDCTDIAGAITGQPGKRFISKSHRIIKDRDFLIIEKLEFSEDKKYLIDISIHKITDPLNLEFEFQNSDNYTVIKDKLFASIDANKIIFPLILRKWKDGDRFTPYGMKGSKKVSDYLIDEKNSNKP